MLTLALLMLSSTTAWAAPQIDAGKITRIDGPTQDEMVNVRNSMGTMTAGVGDQVYMGDTIATSPRQSVVITLKSESELVLAPSSELTIKEITSRESRSTIMKLLYGIVHALVKKQYSAEQPFIIETPTAVMGVRGTEFVVEHDKAGGQSRVHTLDGTVAMAKSIGDLVGNDTVQLVGAGMMSRLLPGMNLPDVPTVFDRAQFFETLKGQSPRFLENLESWRKLRIGAPKLDVLPKVDLPRVPKIEKPKIERPRLEDAPEEIKKTLDNPLKGLFGN